MTKQETIAHAVRGSDGSRYVCLSFVEAINKARYLADEFPQVQFSVVELIERPADEPPCVTPAVPARVFDLTAELRRYFESGTLDEHSDLYLLLCEIEAMRSATSTALQIRAPERHSLYVGSICKELDPTARKLLREMYDRTWDMACSAPNRREGT